MPTISQEIPKTLPRCFSLRTLAEHLSLSRRTLERALAAGELEHYRLGGRAVVPEPAVVSWLESRRVGIRRKEAA